MGKTSRRLYRSRIILVSQNFSGVVPSNSLSVTKGVNFSSCPDGFGKCYCEVNTVDGIMRAARFTEPCISTEGCNPSNVETFTFEGELDPGNNRDSNEVYENDDRERFEETFRYGESARPPRRRLLKADDRDEEYELRENRPSKMKFKNSRVYRSIRHRLDDDNDYDDEDEDDENGETEERAFVDKSGENEKDEEETESTVEPLHYYDYDSGGSSLFEVRIAFVMKVVTLNILLRFPGV
ncbi:uncharacterized protein LOC143143829 isoform X1 [Ptiloglossa arizonensis]|uniref:uncharacterized protein LOC143143829 isoform X1 n=1 Tax=Ptiloglossa arizonensis TaxID=3350558 RepID=UPI003FA0FA73